MAAPNLFISYAQSEEPFVRRLLPQLEEMGFEVWSPSQLPAGRPYKEEIERRVKGSDGIVLVLGDRAPQDAAQDFEWQCALEAKWEDPSKKLIPLLVGDTHVPKFLRTAAARGEKVSGVRIADRRSLQGAVEAIAGIARDDRESAGKAARRHGKPGRVKPLTVRRPQGTEQARRLHEIAEHAALLDPA